jgi:hypothetical protein
MKIGHERTLEFCLKRLFVYVKNHKHGDGAKFLASRLVETSGREDLY